MPLITVIIPVFNGELYIAQCIENIISQTYKNIEILIVNDGSTDNTEAISGRYQVNIINQSNSGVAAARNNGLANASGEYIHFMDVDDLINLEFYERMIMSITNSNADIACCEVNNYKTKRSIVYPHNLLVSIIEDKFTITNVAKQGYVWRYLFKKKLLLENNLFFIEGELGEDTPYSMMAILNAKSITTVHDAVYYYKNRKNSICHTKDKNINRKRHQGWVNVKKFRLKFADEHHIKLPGVRTGKFSRYIDKWFT